jgi:holliday junction DNA helicase RuvB
MIEKNLNRASKIVSPDQNSEDEIEKHLRPRSFDDFTGQKKITENLKIFIEAAKKRKESLDHTLFTGPPGLGKTTLSHIISHEMNATIKVTSGPTIIKPGDLAGILTGLEESSILFIDEIHRLSPIVEEYLYSAMEDYKLDIMIDSGPSARTIQLSLPQFTLIGATTRAGLLTAPLRSRFGVNCRLDYYPADQLFVIVLRSANILNVEIDEEGALTIAKRSRGTPRIANRLVRRARDFAQVKGDGVITKEIAEITLKALDVDEYGLDEMDKRILRTIIEKFDGGPVGLNNISASVGEEAGTIEEVYEPFLIQQGFLQRTPRGRQASKLAYKHFGYKIEESTNTLFGSDE